MYKWNFLLTKDHIESKDHLEKHLLTLPAPDVYLVISFLLDFSLLLNC